MPLETTLHFDQDLVRHAVTCFWRRTVGKRTLLVVCALAVWCGILVARGDHSWQTGAMGAIAAMGLLLCATIYVVHYRNAIAKLKSMGSPSATMRADTYAITFVSGAGATTLPWSSVKELWQFERVWLLLFSPAQFSTLPVADLSPEMQALVTDRIQASGGRIR